MTSPWMRDVCFVRYGTGNAEVPGKLYLYAEMRSRVVFMIDTVRLCIVCIFGFSQKEKFILRKAEFCYDLYYFRSFSFVD
jgi:hypothetical protein